MHLITMPLKPITSSLRLLFQSSILLALFYNSDLMYEVCGPFTLSPITRSHLLTSLFLLQILRLFYPLISRIFSFLLPLPPSSPAHHLLHSYSVKYFLLFLLKIMIALISGEEQRMKFYLSSLFLEIWILGIAFAVDCFRKANIAQVGEILIVDCLYRVAIVYEVTRTFCPNLVLYYSITNLLMVACSQLQTMISKSGNGKSNLLYTAHDIYRIMVLSFFYFFCFSITQLFSYGWKSMIVFLVVGRWWYLMIKDFNDKEIDKSMKWMIITCFSYCFMEILYVFMANELI